MGYRCTPNRDNYFTVRMDKVIFHIVKLFKIHETDRGSIFSDKANIGFQKPVS